jgi:predicted DNA-binding transcriptional regulator AlpA
MANATAAKATSIQPRFIRFGDAPGYLGMCRDEFNKTVRPNVREFPIGKQGVAFDRHELDEWADAYITARAIEKAAVQVNNHPRSERHTGGKGATEWPKKQLQGSRKCRTASGRLTKNTEENEFKKVLELVTGRKRSNT